MTYPGSFFPPAQAGDPRSLSITTTDESSPRRSSWQKMCGFETEMLSYYLYWRVLARSSAAMNAAAVAAHVGAHGGGPPRREFDTVSETSGISWKTGD
eukprot:1654300-Rhodomonas_salina.1